MKRGTSTQILLAIIAAALLLGGGLLRDLGERLPTEAEDGIDILDGLKDLLGDAISPEVTVTRDLEVEGEVSYTGEFVFQDVEPDAVEVEYSPEDTNITADGKTIAVEAETADLRLGGFRGFVSIDSNHLELQGKADSLTSGPTSLSGDAMDVSVDSIQNKTTLEGVEVSELVVEGSSGELEVGDSVSISPTDQRITLNAFAGNLGFEGDRLTLDGKASRVSAGNETIGAGY